MTQCQVLQAVGDAVAQHILATGFVDLEQNRLLAAQVGHRPGAQNQLEVQALGTVLLQNAQGASGVAQVGSGAERSSASGAIGAGRLDVQTGQVGLDLIDQRAHALLNLVRQDHVVRGAVVVQATLLFAIPADRHAAGLGDGHRNVADDLVAIVRRGHCRGDVGCGGGRSDRRHDGLTNSGAFVGHVGGYCGDEADQFAGNHVQGVVQGWDQPGEGVHMELLRIDV